MKSLLRDWWKNRKEELVVAAGLAGQAVDIGLVHGTAAHTIQVVLAALTVAGVYGVKQAKKSPSAQ